MIVCLRHEYCPRRAGSHAVEAHAARQHKQRGRDSRGGARRSHVTRVESRRGYVATVFTF